MNIQFKNLIVDSFMSIDHIELPLKDLGTILVRGYNYKDPEKSASNGSGKSALTAESILWCLTGDTNKEAKTINNIFKPDSVATVKLAFSIDKDEYEVTRINDKNKTLIIIKNGQDISGNTYTKSKEILDKELNFINKEILTSIIILGQGLKGRFSDLKASERKTRLEYLVGIDSLLEKINNSLDAAEQTINKSTTETNLKLAEQNTLITSCQDIIRKYNTQSPITEEVYKEKCKEYNQIVNDYNTIKKEIIEIKNNSQKYLEDKNKYSEELINITSELSSLKEQISNINHKKENIETNIKNLNNQKELVDKAECPTCHQHLSDKELENHIKEELDKLNKELDSLEDTKDRQDRIDKLVMQSNDISIKNNELQIEINKYNTEINNKTNEANELYKKIQEYDNYLKRYEEYQKEQQQVKQIIDDSNSKIEKANKEKTILETKSTKLLNDKNINKYFKNATSRKFRNFLLEGVFNYINIKLEEYSSQLFSDQKIKLESNGNNIDIRLNNKYIEDCSGGECRKIDIAIQFALRDLAKNQRGLNVSLICLDEVLDYLDSVAMEEVIKFIENQTSDVNTMFITSHKEDLKIQYDNVLEVFKGDDELTHIKGA